MQDLPGCVDITPKAIGRRSSGERSRLLDRQPDRFLQSSDHMMLYDDLLEDIVSPSTGLDGMQI